MSKPKKSKEEKPKQKPSQVHPHRGLWQLEIMKAEKTENEKGKGRKLFNGRQIQDVIKRLEDIFIIGGGVTQACAHAEIAKQTYYEFIKDKPYLVDHFKHLSERLVIVSLNTIAKSAQNNPVTAMTILSKKMKEYSPSSTLLLGEDPDNKFTTLADMLKGIKMKNKQNENAGE